VVLSTLLEVSIETKKLSLGGIIEAGVGKKIRVYELIIF
tara:strand:- start:647 stop:763 length:117 start_codon:yes stop_codon:yes gene_type:complete